MNNKDINIKNITLTQMMGHSSEDFTALTLQEDDFGTVADYLDEALDEEPLYRSFKSKALVYGLIAMNWGLVHGEEYKLNYEEYYVALVKAKPKKQDEFEEVRSKLHGEWDEEEQKKFKAELKAMKVAQKKALTC